MAKINREKCAGCGVCVSSCPEAIAIGDDGIAVIKDENADCLSEAAKVCPWDAIEI